MKSRILLLDISGDNKLFIAGEYTGQKRLRIDRTILLRNLWRCKIYSRGNVVFSPLFSSDFVSNANISCTISVHSCKHLLVYGMPFNLFLLCCSCEQTYTLDNILASCTILPAMSHF